MTKSDFDIDVASIKSAACDSCAHPIIIAWFNGSSLPVWGLFSDSVLSPSVSIATHHFKTKAEMLVAMDN